MSTAAGLGIRFLAFWTAVATGGWFFALGSAEVTGLADATTTAGMTGQIALMAIDITAFVIGLVVLTVTGVRARSPPDDDLC